MFGDRSLGFCVVMTAWALTPVSVGGTNYSQVLGGWDGWIILICYMIVGIFVYFFMQNYRKTRNLESKLCPEPECEMELKHKTEPMKS